METQNSARLETSYGDPVLLEGIRAEGDLKGIMFEMRLEQRFRNKAKNNVEVIYTFPLPWGAILLGVDVLLGDKKLTGAVIEKKQAEAQYEEAISEGDAAIMLEKNHDHSYSMNLGNLIANEACVVSLRYAQILQFEQGGLRLLIPTVIAPRYGDAVIDGGLQPHQVTSNDISVEYPFHIQIRIHGNLARARVSSPSHPVSVVLADEVMTVSLTRHGALDRDFVLIADQLAQNAFAIASNDCVLKDHFVALASFCPKIKPKASTAVGVKLLVDCSGSMAGDSIAAAKRALIAIVNSFESGDHFSLSRFGYTVEHRSRGLWRATDQSRLAAQRWVSEMDADLGGTEMELALESTFKISQTITSDVLLITDGEISGIDSTIQSAKASGHRLFIVGVGSSPAESHLRRLAEATGGACDFVAPGEAIEPAVLRTFARLRSPKMTDVKVIWPTNSNPIWTSSPPASVFDGDTVNFYALIKNLPVGEVRLIGTREAGISPEEISCATFSEYEEKSNTLSRMAAFARLQNSAENEAIVNKSDAQNIAVDYQLVTDQTNFLLIHERSEGEKSTDMPELHKVAQMLPAGWGGTGRVQYSTRPASYDLAQIDFSAQSAIPVMSSSIQAAAFDKPMYSRREKTDKSSPQFASRERSNPSVKQSIDRTNPKYWRDTEEYIGLTPFGLKELLRITPQSDWPKTLDDLRDIGLGNPVIDWLELVICTEVNEEMVVLALLNFISEVGTITQSLDGSNSVLRKIQRFFNGDATVVISKGDSEYFKQMMFDLDGITYSNWPNKIYQYPDKKPVTGKTT